MRSKKQRASWVPVQFRSAEFLASLQEWLDLRQSSLIWIGWMG